MESNRVVSNKFGAARIVGPFLIIPNRADSSPLLDGGPGGLRGGHIRVPSQCQTVAVFVARYIRQSETIGEAVRLSHGTSDNLKSLAKRCGNTILFSLWDTKLRSKINRQSDQTSHQPPAAMQRQRSFNTRTIEDNHSIDEVEEESQYSPDDIDLLLLSLAWNQNQSSGAQPAVDMDEHLAYFPSKERSLLILGKSAAGKECFRAPPPPLRFTRTARKNAIE
jgi:hypothetical protein